MTVGTGDRTRLEESLFAPLRKSIATDAWTRLVLLPSTATGRFAETLRREIPGVESAVRPLPEGAENDADAAYAHFDAVLAEALRETPPERVTVDFTRGTKAMSAALVLAAARREIPHLRYITGRRDERGTVVAGSEEVRGIRTAAVAGHRRLDLARDLMRRGNFPAAEAVLPETARPSAGLYPDDLLETAAAVRTAARFYAAASGAEVGEPPDGWKELWPTPAAREWVAALAEERKNPRRLRRLIVDLLANGERRLRQGQHEDALVRAYRVLELVGQARLFDHGFDSGALDPACPAVQAVQARIEKNKQAPLDTGRDGKLRTGRFQVARILKECGDPLAKRPLGFEDEALLKPTLRNNSLSIHGFAVAAPEEPEALRGLFDKLAQLAKADAGADAVDGRLAVARIPSFAAG